MARHPHRALLVVLALLLLPAVASAKQARPYAPSEQKSFDAVLTDWTAITKTPGGKSVFEMQPETFYRAKQQRLLVLEARDVSGERWLKVRLPAWFSHGMTAGWLKADSVDLRVNRWRVEISRAAGTLKLVHDGRVVRTAHVGTGTNSTPTPRRPARDVRPLALDARGARRLDREPDDAQPAGAGVRRHAGRRRDPRLARGRRRQWLGEPWLRASDATTR